MREGEAPQPSCIHSRVRTLLTLDPFCVRCCFLLPFSFFFSLVFCFPHTHQVIERAQEPLGMLQHAARPIGATVKPGPAVVKVPIETVTWAHDESLGGISVLETGQGVLVGGGASAGMPRAALVHLIAVCKPKQHQEGTRSLSPAVNAKASVEGWGG